MKQSGAGRGHGEARARALGPAAFRRQLDGPLVCANKPKWTANKYASTRERANGSETPVCLVMIRGV